MGDCWMSSFRKAEAERIASLRAEMQKIMEHSAGIYRSGESLAGAADKLHELQDRFRDIRLDDRGHLFNTELICAGAIVHARGCRDDGAVRHGADGIARSAPANGLSLSKRRKFLAHSLVYRTADGRPRVEYAPVTITRWPPAERVYGR